MTNAWKVASFKIKSNSQNWIHMKYKDYKIKYSLREIH